MSIQTLPTRTQVQAALSTRLDETLDVAAQIAPTVRQAISEKVAKGDFRTTTSSDGHPGVRLSFMIPEEFHPALKALAEDEVTRTERAEAFSQAIRQDLLAHFQRLGDDQKPTALSVEGGFRSHIAVVEMWYAPLTQG